MELQKHNCEGIAFRVEIPFEKISWKKLVSSFARNPKEVKDLLASQGLNCVLYHRGDKHDFHYHFSARKIRRGRVQKLRFEVSLHPGASVVNSIRRKNKNVLVAAIPAFEKWILDFLPERSRGALLKFTWRAGFRYGLKEFQPIFEIPFKSPFTIPDKGSALGEISISGLKLEFQKSNFGLLRVYIEAFPKFLAIAAIFIQKSKLREDLIQASLVGAERILSLFIKQTTS